MNSYSSPYGDQSMNKFTDCGSCTEEIPFNECPKSQRACGHHCNHSWEQDECCWCGQIFGEEIDAN